MDRFTQRIDFEMGRGDAEPERSSAKDLWRMSWRSGRTRSHFKIYPSFFKTALFETLWSLTKYPAHPLNVNKD